MRNPRVVAIIATYNEQRFIRACIDHYLSQGVEVYLLDNESTDATVDIARQWLGNGVVSIDTLPRRGEFSLLEQLERKSSIAAGLDTDWVIHADADEIRLAPTQDATIPEALAEAQRGGFNVANFVEFTFVPTLEEPDHDHPRFLETMRSYYHFAPSPGPRHPKAWRPSELPGFDIASSGGHRLLAPGVELYPLDFKMRHYIFLGVDHVASKYAQKEFSSAEIERGWHGWRGGFDPDKLRLPSRNDLMTYVDDDSLDTSQPVTRHLFYMEA